MQVKIIVILLIALLISSGCFEDPVDGQRTRFLVIDIDSLAAQTSSCVLQLAAYGDTSNFDLKIDSTLNSTESVYVKFILDTITDQWDCDSADACIRTYDINNILLSEWYGFIRLCDDKYMLTPPILFRNVYDFSKPSMELVLLYYTISDSTDKNACTVEFSWEKYNNEKDDFLKYLITIMEGIYDNPVRETSIYSLNTMELVLNNLDLTRIVLARIQYISKDNRMVGGALIPLPVLK